MYFIIGASGSGKTAVLSQIQLPGHTLLDFDSIGVPENADAQWRQSATEEWIATMLNSGEESKTCLFGQMVLGEILACPSAKKIQEINICFLDCSDTTRIQRLKERTHILTNQHTLNWASWLRMHHHNPQWEQHVIKEHAISLLDFSRWDKKESWADLATLFFCDTTQLSISQVSTMIEEWVKEAEKIDDAITFSNAKPSDLEAIIKLLVNDPIAKDREYTDKNIISYRNAFDTISKDINAYLLVAKKQGEVIGVVQINFIPNLTYHGGTRAMIEGVRVNEDYRGQGIGSLLINKAITLSKQRGCCLIQLTTDKNRPEALKFYEKLGFINSHHGLKLKLYSA